MNLRIFTPVLLLVILLHSLAAAQSKDIREHIEENYQYIENLYKYYHSHPELSLDEDNTSDRLADELRKLDFTVTENIGGHGVVAVLKNGEGPTVMVRTDMDALPINEETNVFFKSTKVSANNNGESVPVMHACGHDMHMSVAVGTARVLSSMRNKWQGTLVFIGQPAEEIFEGAQAMIEDGLFQKFPRPDYVLALHVNSAMASGKVGYTPGYAYANIDEATIVVRGRGGHGAYPDLTVDPIVLASRLILDLQTIVSREISALDPAVVSVGSIHGGTSSNIIPDEVKLQLTLRSFKKDVHEKIIKKIRQKCEAIGRSAGLPEEDWPKLTLKDKFLPSLYNDPELAERISGVFNEVLGDDKVTEIGPLMYGEDFARYGSVRPAIPILMYSLGSQKPEDIKADQTGKIELPSTHSSKYIPDLEPTIKTGILTMSSAVMDLLTRISHK